MNNKYDKYFTKLIHSEIRIMKSSMENNADILNKILKNKKISYNDALHLRNNHDNLVYGVQNLKVLLMNIRPNYDLSGTSNTYNDKRRYFYSLCNDLHNNKSKDEKQLNKHELSYLNHILNITNQYIKILEIDNDNISVNNNNWIQIIEKIREI